MKDRKKIILIILAILTILIILLVLFLNLKGGNNSTGNTGNQGNVNIGDGNATSNQKKFKKVDDYEEFFSIQNTLNDTENLSVSYVIKELYLNQISDTKYYFINCNTFESDMILETVNYKKNNYYLVIVNNGYYELKKIDEDIEDLMTYAKNYSVETKKISNGKRLKNGETKETNIISLYLTYFKDILISDTESAYDMLTKETKEKYINYTDFYNSVINIYNNISTKVFAYNKKEENNKKVYYIEDDNRNKIVIYEEDIMNFKISY